MTERNEPEKLTPDSSNSYDGSSTPMPEDNKEYDPTDDSEHKDTASKSKADEEREEDERKTKEKQTKLAKILAALFFPDESENIDEQRNAAIEALVKFAASVKEPQEEEDSPEQGKSEQQEWNLVKLLKLVATPEQLHPHSSDEDEQTARNVPNVFEKVLNTATQAGFDGDALMEKLRQLDEPPVRDEHRVDKLEEYFNEQIEKASKSAKAALEQLKDELAQLSTTTDAGSDVQKDSKEGASILTDVLEEVEEHHDSVENLDAQEQEFEKMFAGVLVRVFDKKAEAARKAEKAADAQEEREAEMLINTLFMADTHKDIKTKLVAYMLAEHFSTDNVKDPQIAQIIAAKREKILHYAELAGLDRIAIGIKEADMPDERPVTDETVNDVEKVAGLTTFEQLVVQQIEQAEPEAVKEIRDGWIAIRDNADLSDEMREQAEEAVKKLGDIIELKKKIREARSRGERMNPDEVPLLFTMDDDEDEEKEEKLKLAELLAALFTSARVLNGEQDKQVISTITDLILASKETTEEKEQLLSALAACFPMIANADTDTQKDISALQGFLTERAWLNGLNFPDVPAEISDQSIQPRIVLERLLRTSLHDISKKDLAEMRQAWEELLANESLPPVVQMQLEQARDSIGTILENKPAPDARQRPVEEPEAAKAKAVKERKEQEAKEEDVHELERANRIISGFIQDKEMDTYLNDLLEKIKTGLPRAEMEGKLKELNARARSITSVIKSEITNEDSTNYMKNKVNTIIYFEASVDEYRKFLIHEINKGKESKEETEDGVAEVSLGKVDALKAELSNQANNSSLTAEERLTAYIENLTEALKNPWLLDHGQLKAAYESLLLQDAIVREELMRQGQLIECVDFADKVREVEMKLYGQLVIAENTATSHDDNTIKSIEETASRKAKEHALQSGDAYYMEATGAITPVYEQPSRGESPVYIGTDIKDIVRASATPQNIIPDTLDFFDEKTGQKLTGADADHKRRVLRSQIGDLDRGEVFTDDQKIGFLQDELSRVISDAIKNNASDQLVNLNDLGEARKLANAINKQRLALNSKRGYKGMLEKRRELDPGLYGEGKFIHEVLNERMDRIKIELGIRAGTVSDTYTDSDHVQQKHVRRTNEELYDYYKELQRWANILLDNDIRRNPQNANKPGALRLSNERYEFYKNFVEPPGGRPKITKDTIQAEMARVIGEIDYMRNTNPRSGGDFFRYFKKNLPDPENPNELLGIPYNRPEDMGMYAPEALEATMKQIADAFSTAENDYHTGGNRELVNEKGEFMYHNLYYWVRSKINADVDYNKDGEISPFGKIIIKLDMGQISMYELLLLIPEYTSQRKFEITVDKDTGEVESGWGAKTEVPGFGAEQLSYIAAEMEFRQMTHQLRLKYVDTTVSGAKDQYMNLMKQLHNNNHWTRANNFFLWFGLPSSTTNGTKEIDEWLGPKEKQGSIGKAMSDMLVATYYYSEMTDYYKTRDVNSDGKAVGKEREKNFNENMFYRFLEPNGANRYLIKMAEGALGYNNDAKKMYAQFIGKRIQAEAAVYKRGRSAEEQKMIDQLVERWKPAADDEKIEVDFTDNKNLRNFCLLVEKDVLKTSKSEDAFNKHIRDSILDNLKNEYFKDLKTMKVGRIADKDLKNPKKPTDRKSSHRFLMINKDNPTIEFGEIELDGGQKMKDFLDSFDVDQVKLFDYSNDPNDRNSPFYGITDEATLRRRIDWFMDPNKNARNHKLFKNNEKMMLAFTRHVTRLTRKDLNNYRTANENEFARDMSRRSIRYVMEKAYGIDSEESMYAWWWARDYIYLWGIATTQDVDGIGFRWDGKIINTGKWRPRRLGKDGGGNEHTFDEFLALSLPFVQAIRVSNLSQNEPLGSRSPFYWMQGGEGGYVKPRALREFDKRSNYQFEIDSEQQFAGNNLENASDLIDLLSKTEFDFTGIISFDVLGNVVFDYGKARELFGKWRKAIRYTYGKNDLDYREKIWVNGREKTLYEHFFGPKTRALNELIFRDSPRTRDFMYRDPSDAVMMSVVAAEVAEHRAMFASGHHWSIQNVQELERFLLQFMTERDQAEDENFETKTKVKPGTLLTPKIFAAALKAYHTAYYKMYLGELGTTLGTGLWDAFKEGLEDFFKGKWVY